MGWSARLLEQRRREREAEARYVGPWAGLEQQAASTSGRNDATNEREKAVISVRISDNSYDVVPADIYPAVVSKIEEKETMYGPGVKVFFTISDGDQAGKIVDGLASLPENGLSPKSKLRMWLEAIVGKSLAGYQGDIDLNKMIGKPCRINVINVPGKDGTGEFARIKDVLPLRKPAPKPEVAPTETDLF